MANSERSRREAALAMLGISLMAAAATVAIPALWNTALQVRGTKAVIAMALIAGAFWWLAVVDHPALRILRYIVTVVLAGLLSNLLIGPMLGSNWSWRNLLAAGTLALSAGACAVVLVLFLEPRAHEE